MGSDRWQDVLSGSARWAVVNADCLDVLRDMPDGCVDAVVTDPPYSVSLAGVAHKGVPGKGTRNLDFFEGDTDWQSMTFDVVIPAVRETIRVMKPTASCYWWCSHRQLSHISDALEVAGYRTRVIIWRKLCPPPPAPGAGWGSAVELCVYGYKPGRTWNAPRSGRMDNIIASDSYRHGQPGKVDHPTQKPLACFQQFVEWSTNPDDLILDVFAGSGTSGVVSINAGRCWIGCELKAEYVDIAKARIEPKGALL